ncbi:unnamed protein product [Cladocopium goreaui]|uniref:Retrovirus-related Pol polyprotein from transposon RE1 (Retro element 1) (AtRE1) n=1 Tax=Cladocopium goreaui TaxID=2562237 RepID=A0A9P1M4K5_9DINO|nr:unnamed protein product [Cladocopium goreaui]
MNMVAEALLTQVINRQPKISSLSWEEHLRHGHIPFRRDCLVCQQSLQQQPPHRKVKHPLGGVLSIDTTGPFIRAYDAGGYKSAYILVGALTWTVPKDSKIREEEVPELEGEAPNFEARKDEEVIAMEDQHDQPQEQPQGILDDEELEVEERQRAPEGEDEVPKVEECQRAPEGEAERKEEEKEEFETRVFRLAAPMYSKKATEVTRAVMDMMLRLRADGYHIGHIHSDQGHEFQGHFKRWCRERGVLLTRTPGDDPRANGRAETAVKSIKTQVRRILLQAQAEPTWWPWATRYVNELNRSVRLAKTPDYPPFLSDIMVRKRRWRRGTFETSTETVKYLCPAPEEHGHWVMPKDEAPRITKLIMKATHLPLAEEQWMALERESLDALAVRRRMRGKSTIRKLQEEDREGKEEEEEKKRRVYMLRLIEKEMCLMVDDDPELAKEEFQILANIRKMASVPNEEEEVLQTRIVSPKEVSDHWPDWIPAAKSEVDSLLYDKQAFKEIGPEELSQLRQEAEKAGRGIEFIPSKLVFTRKPGPDGGRKKMRWVACGNLEPKKEDEDNFSSGADAASLRILAWCAALFQWSASVLDVRTAFLNAKMVLSEDEDVILVKPPWLLTEKAYLRKDVYYLPEKAIYGLRRSPKLCGITRDETISSLEIQGEYNGKNMDFHFEALQSEPNLWRLVNSNDDEDTTTYAMLMTYVDDIMLASSPNLLNIIQEKLRTTWSTSTPEMVGETPVRFLGVEISKTWCDQLQREVWMVTQQSYTTDMVQKETDLKAKKIPISRDQSQMGPSTEAPTTEMIRAAQKAVGEVLWLTTRARPDIMFTVARMGSSVTKAPEAVLKASIQLKGYLKATSNEGLIFKVGENEHPVLTVFTDASFAPDSQESHGSFIVMLGATPIFWRSGRQGFVTLSTAEAELTEIVEGMIAGESIFVILAELFPKISKLVKTDSMSAQAILANEGGNWRTRHLRLRCSFARQSILAGEWSTQHVAGEYMLADIGTKPLSSVRFEFLKKLMGMGSLPMKSEEKVEVEEQLEEKEKVEAEEKERKKEEGEKRSEKQDGREANKDGHLLAEAAQVLRLITLAATMSISKAEKDGEGAEEMVSFEIIILYTFAVVFITLMAQRIWEAGVRGWRFLRQHVLAQPGSHPGRAVEGSTSSSSREPLRSTAASSTGRSIEKTGRSSTMSPAPLPDQHAPLPRDQHAQLPRVQRRAQEPERSLRGDEAPLPHDQPEGPTSSTSVTQRDVLRECDEIEREERLVTAELNRASPEHPLLGPPSQQLNEYETVDFPFLVITTKCGTVYHSHWSCRYLTASATGAKKMRRWCLECRREAVQSGVFPSRGAAMFLTSWEADVHSNPMCERADRANALSLCTVCLDRFQIHLCCDPQLPFSICPTLLTSANGENPLSSRCFAGGKTVEVAKLRLDDPLDFSEGDHGVSGGIQVWEAANLHPTNVDTVKRLGGDPKHPFPLEEELQTEADKCRKVFHLFQKQMMAVKGEASVSSLGPSSGTAPSVNSVNSAELTMATLNS